jgi:hypothetical protein
MLPKAYMSSNPACDIRYSEIQPIPSAPAEGGVSSRDKPKKNEAQKNGSYHNKRRLACQCDLGLCVETSGNTFYDTKLEVTTHEHCFPPTSRQRHLAGNARHYAATRHEYNGN